MPRPRVSYVGRRFGRLTVIEDIYAWPEKTRELCRCDCGETKVASRDSLLCGKVQSCGCLQKEVARVHILKAIEARRSRRCPVHE